MINSKVICRKKFLFLTFLLTLGCFMVLQIKWGSVSSIKWESVSPSEYTSDTKFILYWSPFWTVKDYYMGYGFNPFKNCKYKNCYATANRTLIPLEKFDALLFHTTYSKKKHGVPWVRKPHQRYIFMNVEPPVHISPNLKVYSSYFNWTMSYRFDSDIIRRHGHIVEGKTNYTMPSLGFLSKKSRLAAWFVSNCRTPSKREVLGKEIQNFIPVDKYGSCGNMSCSRKAHNGKISSAECYTMVEKNYKFYFSFENSYCKDYSTEKLYKILEKDIIPVVYGGSDYKLAAPPHSVINVEDFDTVQDLTDYLKYLNDNVDEYLKYFEWKRDYSVDSTSVVSRCQICRKLHEPIKESVYHNLHEWWWGKNKSICKLKRELPPIVSSLLNK